MRFSNIPGVLLCVAGFSLGLAGCEASGPLGPGSRVDGGIDLSTAEVTVLSGAEQGGEVGSMLPDPLAVAVTGPGGQPLAGVAVEWSFQAGRGRRSNSSNDSGARSLTVETDSEGIARVWWQLDTISGSQTASAALAETAASAGAQGAPFWRRLLEFRATARVGSAARVHVSPDVARVEADDTLGLAAVVTDRYGNLIPEPTIRWRSSNTTVARVDDQGRVETGEEGSAVISARVSTAVGVSSVEVMSSGVIEEPDTTTVPVVTTVRITPATASMNVGDTIRLLAQVLDQSGASMSGVPVTWSSNNAGVLTVGTGGLVTARGVGAATVSATAAGVTATRSIAVGDPVSRVVASPDTIRLQSVGASARISARAEDSAGGVVQNVAFEFLSSNSSIAQVDGMGNVIARAVGIATITVAAICCGDTDSIVVLVDDVPDTLVISVDGSTITSETLELEVGQNAVLSATALNQIGSVIGDAEIEWSSSRPNVASVDAAGRLTALSAGETQVSASAAGVTAIVPTVVSEVPQGPPALGSLDISPGSVSLEGLGTQRQLSVTARDSLGNVMSGQSVTWTSSNTSVATVNGSGMVTARGVGTAMIMAAAACCSSDEVPVTVSENSPPPPPASVAIRGHEPSGMRTLLDYGFDGPIPSGGNDQRFNDGSGLGIVWNDRGTVRQVNRAGSPQSPSGQMEREYVPGLSGTGVGDLYLDLGGVDVAYMAAWVQHEDGFEWNTTSQKMAFFFEAGGSYTLLQTQYFGQFLSLYRSSTPYNPNQGITPNLNGGGWHYIEFLVDRTNGGEAWVWLDGRLVNNQRIPMPSRFVEFKWDSTWGGGGNKRTTSYQWTDHLYVSVR